MNVNQQNQEVPLKSRIFFVLKELVRYIDDFLEFLQMFIIKQVF